MNCKLAVGVKKTPAYIDCMKAWYADAKAAALALPGTDPAFLAPRRSSMDTSPSTTTR